MTSAPSPQPLTACPNCDCRDLFIRKDFPQKIGMFIVVTSAIIFLILAASRSRFYLGSLVLLLAVVIDAILYFLVPKITVCYRCRAEFRNIPINPDHIGFDLATAERYRAK